MSALASKRDELMLDNNDPDGRKRRYMLNEEYKKKDKDVDNGLQRQIDALREKARLEKNKLAVEKQLKLDALANKLAKGNVIDLTGDDEEEKVSGDGHTCGTAGQGPGGVIKTRVNSPATKRSRSVSNPSLATKKRKAPAQAVPARSVIRAQKAAESAATRLERDLDFLVANIGDLPEAPRRICQSAIDDYKEKTAQGKSRNKGRLCEVLRAFRQDYLTPVVHQIEEHVYDQLVASVFVFIPSSIIKVTVSAFTHVIRFTSRYDRKLEVRADATGWFFVFGKAMEDMDAAKECFEDLKQRQFDEVSIKGKLYRRGWVVEDSTL